MKKILIIQTASIGDVILATPLAEALHKLYPAAQIDFLLKKGNEGLFRGHPFLNQLLVWDKSSRKHRNLLRILRLVRSGHYDLVVNVQRFASSGILTALSGAGSKVGFRKNPFSFLFSKSVRHDIGNDEVFLHETERNLQLISHLGDTGRPEVRLYPTVADEGRVKTFQSGHYICISPASLWFTKQFPPAKWVEFIREVPPVYRIYLLGSAQDQEICAGIILQSGRPGMENLAGKLNFLESAALMKGAVMNYMNDSAPLHLASAVNAPATAVFCSTVPAFGFGPLSAGSEVVEIPEPLACRPCGLHGMDRCPEGHFKCAMKIRKEQLLERLPAKSH